MLIVLWIVPDAGKGDAGLNQAVLRCPRHAWRGWQPGAVGPISQPMLCCRWQVFQLQELATSQQQSFVQVRVEGNKDTCTLAHSEHSTGLTFLKALQLLPCTS